VTQANEGKCEGDGGADNQSWDEHGHQESDGQDGVLLLHKRRLF
jgi:hypothetical protein